VSRPANPSLWNRLRRLFAASEEQANAEDAGDETSGASPPAGERPGGGQEEEKPRSGAPPESFSALGLRDRVVVMLLFEQVVRIEQVAAAWRHWNDPSTNTPKALWRVVARLPSVNADAVFAEAARVYAFEPVDFNMYGARGLVRKRRGAFTHAQWKRMVVLNVVPVRTEYDKEKEARRWIFATHDPARPAVQHLLADLDVPSHELRYALRTPLEDVFDDALPRLARERPEPRSFPPQELPSREESHRLLENLSHGAAPSESASQVPDSAPAGEAPSSPAALFDDILAGLVQSSARTAYLFAGEQDRLEIYHRRKRNVRHWRTKSRASADAMIDFISGRILSLRATQKQPEEAVERWVGGRPLAFRPSIEPARDLTGALPVHEEREVVVIRLL
jgi:hypothetical protein